MTQTQLRKDIALIIDDRFVHNQSLIDDLRQILSHFEVMVVVAEIVRKQKEKPDYKSIKQTLENRLGDFVIYHDGIPYMAGNSMHHLLSQLASILFTFIKMLSYDD